MDYPIAINHKRAIQLINSESSKHQLESEKIPLFDAAGRVLSDSISAPNHVPEFNCSRMDGYAVNLGQIKQQTVDSVFFTCKVGEPIHAKAQEQLIHCNDRAIPVMTGALLPNDCDAIIIREKAQIKDECLVFEQLPAKGQYIRESGSDLQAGQLVVQAQQILTPAHLGLLSSLGMVEVTVYKQPVVALLLTGDEIIQPGESCSAGQFYDANTLMLKQLLIEMGCEVKLFPTIKDNVDQITDALQSNELNDCHLIITVGGVSMGEKDWIPQVISQLGTIVFHKIKVRPGFPVLFAKLNKSLFFGVPGNPVSAYTALCQYVYSAVNSLRNLTKQNVLWTAEMLHEWNKAHDRREFLRGYFSIGELGQLEVKVCGEQHSSRIESLSEANCFIVLDEQCHHLNSGDQVQIQSFTQYKIL